jgi:hypothetical protein
MREPRQPDVKRKSPPPPHRSKDPGWPPSGPNRYRLATNGAQWRVEEYSRRWWAPDRWRPITEATVDRPLAVSWLHSYQMRALQQTEPWRADEAQD